MLILYATHGASVSSAEAVGYAGKAARENQVLRTDTIKRTRTAPIATGSTDTDDPTTAADAETSHGQFER